MSWNFRFQGKASRVADAVRLYWVPQLSSLEERQLEMAKNMVLPQIEMIDGEMHVLVEVKGSLQTLVVPNKPDKNGVLKGASLNVRVETLFDFV